MTAHLPELTHWALALVPVLVLLAVFVWLDAFKLMSLGEVVTLLIFGGLGALLAYPVSGRMLDTLPIGFSTYSRFVAPWIEEAIKGAIIVALFRFNRIGYKLDAVISGFAIGAGFSVVENIIYLTMYPTYGTGTWLVRGVGTAVMHGATLAIFATAAHQFAERETRQAAGDFKFNLLWFLPGYLVAVALHTAFNQFPDQPLVAMLGAIVITPVVLIAVFHFGTVEAERWLTTERAAHRAQLDTLRSGRWPESPSGRKVAALAERLDTEGSKRVRRYWELHAWLISEAEEIMIEEEQGDVKLHPDQVRAALAEIDGLRRALGRSTIVALNAVLPFSRNDYWEVWELKRRLHGR
ncbi:MAG TPA: PrsW family glutamic-type intramembrane protease [Sphingomicrobium sp.]|nr:PrsW family glutamic-type intramembrane protease [Sphingomicrobium sp.]